MNPYYSYHTMMWTQPIFGVTFAVILILAVVWSLIWKGIALWHAARNHQTAWFVVMLILNTLGILEIIYILFFRKNKNHSVVTTTTTHTTTVSTPSPESTPTTDTSSTSSGQ